MVLSFLTPPLLNRNRNPDWDTRDRDGEENEITPMELTVGGNDTSTWGRPRLEESSTSRR